MNCTFWTLLVFIADILKISSYQLNLDKYHSHEEMTAFLNNFSKDNYNLTSLYTIGKSVEGRELWVLEISAGKDTFLRPNVKLIGNIHGNEPVGRELLLYFAQYLVEKYNEGDRRVRELLDFARVHILPSMNPDGFRRAMNQSVPGGPQSCSTGPGRRNMLDVDLNRNFPDHFRANKKETQSETRAVKEWLKTYPFVLSASLHGGSLVASYPFDNKDQNNPGEDAPNTTPDDDVFKHLAMSYSNAHPTMHQGLPCPGASSVFPNGITNGAAWYPLTGGMQDYNYVVHGCMELTLEISCCKFPNASELFRYWEANREPLVVFLEEVRRGIRGVVVDEKGVGVPNATLRIRGRDIPFHTTAKGEFWRILLPNAYYLDVEADGFKSKKEAIHINEPIPNKWSQYKSITIHRIGSEETQSDPGVGSNASIPYSDENRNIKPSPDSPHGNIDTHRNTDVTNNDSLRPESNIDMPQLERNESISYCVKLTHSVWVTVSFAAAAITFT